MGRVADGDASHICLGSANLSSLTPGPAPFIATLAHSPQPAPASPHLAARAPVHHPPPRCPPLSSARLPATLLILEAAANPLHPCAPWFTESQPLPACDSQVAAG